MHDLVAFTGNNSSTLPLLMCEFHNPIMVPAGTDLPLRGEASAAGAMTAWVEGVLVDA